MPTFVYDITDEAVEIAKEVMLSMVGNPGQETLVNDLYIDASAVVIVDIDGPSSSLNSEYNIEMISAHPEAIYIIMDAGKLAFEEYAERAGDVRGFLDIAFSSL